MHELRDYSLHHDNHSDLSLGLHHCQLRLQGKCAVFPSLQKFAYYLVVTGPGVAEMGVKVSLC